ncbi:GNAT family N-acetyltransferase [Geotalea sp. SG265]|uniref:lipid II:glycine glycyltransferase FemX n=1 Tax=Geotalea sp. SG265 TaxID=2922867 RepID=UPI001FAFC001|nr:GNAT family N-acetyltransferase [Geotalea sp. SG265]
MPYQRDNQAEKALAIPDSTGDCANGSQLSLAIIDPLQHPQWDDLLLSLEGCSFFHTTGWARVLSESYDYTPLYFVLYGSDRLEAVIPVMEVKSILTGCRGVSLAFTDYCRPIAGDQRQFDHLLKSIVAYGKKAGWQTIELRGAGEFLPSATASASYLGHVLELSPDEQQVYRRFRGSTKQNIKKANAAGVEINICDTPAALEVFQRLNCITRKKHGMPPQPDRFFRNVGEHVIAKGKGFIVLASCGKKPIAASVFFHFGRTGVYKYGASDDTHQHLRPNNLVIWEAIKWFCRNGFESFCFGRTDPGNNGLRQFKNGWGTRETTIHYYRYDLRRDSFVPGEIELDSRYTRLLGKLPIPLLKTLGSLLYRHKG